MKIAERVISCVESADVFRAFPYARRRSFQVIEISATPPRARGFFARGEQHLIVEELSPTARRRALTRTLCARRNTQQKSARYDGRRQRAGAQQPHPARAALVSRAA